MFFGHNFLAVNSNLEAIHLERNRLTSISNRAFKGLSKLLTLTLKDNHLNHLSVDAFRDLPQLMRLDISSNSFTDLPFAITELDNLENLFLSVCLSLVEMQRQWQGCWSQVGQLYVSSSQIKSPFASRCKTFV